LRVERNLGRRLIVEIAEHQAGAAGADLADFAGRRLRIRVVPAPDADLEPSQARPQVSTMRSGGSSGSVYWCEQVSVMP
jgi:hypothetical protein